MQSGTAATADAECPAGTFPTGGGFEVITASGYTVYQELPVNLDSSTPGPDAWRVTGMDANPPGNLSPVFSQVICRAEMPRYVKKRGQLPEGAPGAVTLTAKCPKGMHVTGGGAAAGINGTPGAAYVNSTYPIDGADADAIPDDGWRARLYGVRQPGTRVIAICASETPSYDERTLEVAPASNGGAFLECSRRTHVLGVGVRIDGSAAQARAAGAGSIDAFKGNANDDANQVPDDNAVGNGLNESGDPKNVTVFGVCG